MSVVQLKARRRKRPVVNIAVLSEIDARLGAVFSQLGERYGVHAVTTVAFTYIAEAVERARLAHRPNEDAWLADLRKRFDDAMRGKPPTPTIRLAMWRWWAARKTMTRKR